MAWTWGPRLPRTTIQRDYMDRNALAALDEGCARRGVQLHELLRIDRAQLNGWLQGAPIPKRYRDAVEWWTVQLRRDQALEASGLPECAELKALDERATAAILGSGTAKEKDRAAEAVLAHSTTCALCRKRKAVAESAGPTRGEPFPGYRRMTETPEERAQSLWVFAVIGCIGLGATYLEGGTEPRADLPWLLACMNLLFPWLLWDGVKDSRSNQVAALVCVVSGTICLFVTDFGLLMTSGWRPFAMPGLLIALGLWTRSRKSRTAA